MGYFAHASAIIDEGASIGERTKIWHFSHVMAKAKIGADCSLGQNVYIANQVSIGRGVKIQNNVSVYEGVVLEDYVFCGPSMVFTNVVAPRSKFPVGTSTYSETRVKVGATIGANATVVCGTTVGAWSLIGAGAVVSTDVPDFALMVGVPARRIAWVCGCGKTLAGDSARLICRCDRQYAVDNETLKQVGGPAL